MTEKQVLLCFDYGEKRIGVAVGQTLTGTATPLETVPVKNNKPDWERIAELIKQWSPDALVVGDPLHMDGSRQDMTEAADRFSRQLAGRYKLDVHRADERLTSHEAKQRLKDTRNLDPVAAQIMLESWLAAYQSRNDTIGTQDPAAEAE